jgi:AcrR family transcriptional regulator
MYIVVKAGSEVHDGSVPVDRLTPERRRQLTKEALIAAAAETFTRKGFHAASLDEIAEAAGFTRGAIYSNFGSKEELLFAVIDRFDDMALSGIAEAMDAEYTEDPTRGAAVAADVWSRLFFRPPDLLALGLELRLYALRNPDARKRLAELERQTSKKLTGFIEEEFSRRNIPIDRAGDLADLGRAAVDGLVQAAAIDEERADHYKRLVSYLFVLLAETLGESPELADDQEPRA